MDVCRRLVVFRLFVRFIIIYRIVLQLLRLPWLAGAENCVCTSHQSPPPCTASWISGFKRQALGQYGRSSDRETFVFKGSCVVLFQIQSHRLNPTPGGVQRRVFPSSSRALVPWLHNATVYNSLVLTPHSATPQPFPLPLFIIAVVVVAQHTSSSSGGGWSSSRGVCGHQYCIRSPLAYTSPS